KAPVFPTAHFGSNAGDQRRHFAFVANNEVASSSPFYVHTRCGSSENQKICIHGFGNVPPYDHKCPCHKQKILRFATCGIGVTNFEHAGIPRSFPGKCPHRTEIVDLASVDTNACHPPISLIHPVCF